MNDLRLRATAHYTHLIITEKHFCAGDQIFFNADPGQDRIAVNGLVDLSHDGVTSYAQARVKRHCSAYRYEGVVV